VERFTVDDRPQGIHPDRPDVIAAGHLRFEFDYAGLSFAMPQRVQYEYRLEGFDRDWTQAGTRRTAFYTNIPQGRYRFQVRAYLGEPGTGHPWTQTEITFVLRPHFYQTIWFYLLLTVLVAALVLLIVRWRLYLARQRFDVVMAERNRIAREIHDTLAQGYVGVSVQLEVLGELLRRQRLDAAGSQLQRLQQLVRDGLEDARRSIWALRSHDASEQTLPVRLRRLVEKTAAAELNATVDIHGATRQLEPETEEELLRVAQEAIQNVQKHARATHLALRLEYDERTVVLTVTDNGVGFPAILQSSAPQSPAGHFGLTGMRERAELVGATLEIASQPGAGTTVRMTVPEGDDRSEKES
jgi:signal transduction histidine kinase